MNKFKPVLLGIILGIVLFIIVTVSISANVVHKFQKDYSNEIETVTTLLEESKEPVFQIDYILAGLNLSPQFKVYLKVGVEKGWWNEEFLSQVVLDDLLPIYAKQFSQVAKLAGNTEKIQKIKDLISKLKEKFPEIVDFLESLDLDKLKEKLYELRDAFLSLDINRIILAIQRIKDMINHMDPDKVKDLINKIKDLLNGLDLDKIKDKLDEIKNKLDEIKDKLNDIDLSGVKDKLEEIKDKLNDIDLSGIKDKLEEIKDKLDDVDWNHIKHVIHRFLYNLKIKIENLLNDIDDLINDIHRLIQNIMNALNNLLSIIYDFIFQDIMADHVFINDITIGSITIPKEVLNGIDINVIKVYDDRGTTGALNLGDDILYITGITVAPEITTSAEGEGLRIVKLFNGPSGNGLEVTGATASIINNQIDNINTNV